MILELAELCSLQVHLEVRAFYPGILKWKLIHVTLLIRNATRRRIPVEFTGNNLNRFRTAISDAEIWIIHMIG